MKKLLVLPAFVVVLYSEASARVRIPVCSACEYIIPVADLPDSVDFYSDEYNAYADVAYIYKQFWVLWVPVWNYEGRYCLSIKEQDIYFDITEEELASYKATYGLDLPSNPLSFWDKFGGKAVVLAILAFIVWGLMGRGGSDDDEDDSVST